jgi:hypothetical protein
MFRYFPDRDPPFTILKLKLLRFGGLAVLPSSGANQVPGPGNQKNSQFHLKKEAEVAYEKQGFHF